ncbi:potassium channel family protein [Planococcus kocurii]|uniref:potassium channel family protein n=1 Tax=Planococcus kocurii TaxID=1374 RepID=UPI003D08F7F1
MREFLKNLMNKRPIIYGGWFLSSIPLYAVAFTFLPESSFQLNNHESGFFSYFYFSIITITTLGYGDITPVGDLGQLLTASESLLGIILIGLFLNSLSHQHGIEVQENEKQTQIKRDEERAIERFSAFNQLVELNINRYKMYLFAVTTPINERNSGTTFNEAFKFNDMRDLFKSTARLSDHHFTPAIEYYFKSLKELVESLEELVKLGYVQSWPEIENLCIKFIEDSKELDFSDYILNQPNVKIGEQNATEFDEEMIKNHEGEVQFRSSNAINAYVALYHLIQKSYGFIRTYRGMALEIIKTKQDAGQ